MATTATTAAAAVAAATKGTSRNRASAKLVETDVSPLLFKRLSDESLGSRLASGEAAAFDELYRRYSNRLAAYGSHLLGDAASGDDVAQAAMLKAYAALRAGRVPERVKPWLFRIAHNTAIDLVVRRRELPSDELPDTPSLDHEPFAGVLVEALATLPDRQRRVYVLREVHGLRIDETAAELGLTAAQVEQSLFAARNRLAEQLVFGDRLNCVTVQRLAAGPLDAPERRALKTHLRACRECRQTLGLRGRALSLFPTASGLEWLRGLGAGLLGGGAPAAAKVGALVATATIAAGGSVAVEQTTHRHARHATLQLLHRATVLPRSARPVLQASVAVAVAARPAPVVPRHVTTAHDDRRVGSTETDGNDGSGDSSSKRGDSVDDTPTQSSSGETRPAGSDSGDGGTREGGSRMAGAFVESGRSDGGGDRSSGSSGTTARPATEESSSPDGASSDDGSGGSSPGTGDQSGDSAATPAATATVPVAPPPLPAVTVPSGD